MLKNRIRSKLYQAYVEDEDVIKHIEEKHPLWTYEEVRMLARNPLIFAKESDAKWRPQLVKAFTKYGSIKEDIPKADLSVFYLYVAVYLAHKGVWKDSFVLDTKLEDELYDEIVENGVPDRHYNRVIDAICKLPEKEANIILYRYGFANGHFYRPYENLQKRLPKEYSDIPTILKQKEKDALEKLRELLPPLFTRINEKEALLQEKAHTLDKEKRAQIALHLIQEYGVRSF